MFTNSMKKTFLGLVLGFALAGGVALASDHMVSDYQGVNRSDGSTLTLVERDGYIFAVNDSTGIESIVTITDLSDGSIADVKLK